MSKGAPGALRRKFEKLRDEWKERTLCMSGGMERDPAYRKIIKLGKPVLPLLFEDMAKDCSFWEHAICKITGCSPEIPEWARGRAPVVVHYFLNWGRDRGWYDAPFGARINDAPVKVRHADLYPSDPESRFRSVCPKCYEGLLLVRRDETTGLVAEDRCVACGQAFVYSDFDEWKDSIPKPRLST